MSVFSGERSLMMCGLVCASRVSAPSEDRAVSSPEPHALLGAFVTAPDRWFADHVESIRDPRSISGHISAAQIKSQTWRGGGRKARRGERRQVGLSLLPVLGTLSSATVQKALQKVKGQFQTLR